MKKLICSLAILAGTWLAATVDAQDWWKTWETHPQVPEVTAATVKQIVLSGEKARFVYCGYQVPETICGSFYLPYTLVPPNSDGSRVDLDLLPKDAWIFCYCP